MKCKRNGIRREGESCVKNNLCSYPACMEKPYFTKYLPRLGDYDNLKIGEKVFCGGGDDGNTENMVLLDYTGQEYGVCRAKLFLCSRDIKKGDKVISICDGAEGIVKGWLDEHMDVIFTDEGKECDFASPSDAVVKVIGEVSPEAAWAKEGEGFDEHEVHRCFVHEDISKLSDPMKRKVKLKGPCGHFH